MVIPMAPHRVPLPHAEAAIAAPPVVHSGVLVTQEDFDALVLELDRLRDRYRAEFARNLRDAKTFGSPGENDDVLAVFEEAAIPEARIAQLEDVLRTASVVDDRVAFDGRARLGCTVQIHDDRGRKREYRLVGRRRLDAPAHQVSLASPVGKALAGARVGDLVRVPLPDGRTREMHVLDVAPGRPELSAVPGRTAKAA
jgi:transcription elongation factor GreA